MQTGVYRGVVGLRPLSVRVTKVRRAVVFAQPDKNPQTRLIRLGEEINQMRVLQLISAQIESQANLQTFESYAGRCAMLGVTVAMASEFLTEASFFPAVGKTELLLLLMFSVLCSGVGVTVALLSRNARQGRKFYGAVLAALVSASQNGFSNESIDKVVDKVLKNVFSKAIFVADELI
eukprot:TRINITY_DN77_c1_g2_i1.p3 TRINITY_DN77_c1_g2~~TRINITY_DN77_c1_g2_i1.p3  ORF type:complete len:178 (-),score=15.25 TRINITY_DN77_c1_g2_i1:951-1484(-)